MSEIKHTQTHAVRTQTKRSENREHSAPIYMTSSFVFNDLEHARGLFADELEGPVYSRYSNPNCDEFINKMCLLEGAETGLATASGMASMFLSTAGLLKSGDHFLASRSLFLSNYQIFSKILKRWNIECDFVDLGKQDTWEQHIKKNTRLLFVESPSNPGLDLVDLKKASEMSKAYGMILVVDNCFATPVLQNPLKLGADIVCHSATKFIDGQGRFLGGCILGRKDLFEDITFLFKNSGPTMSAFNAWGLSKSLETLHTRLEKHCENAVFVTSELDKHPSVKWLKYPFLKSHPYYETAKKQMKSGGSLFCFEMNGGIEQAKLFMDHLGWLSHSPNFGDTRTIVTHPRYTTHSRLTPEERAMVGITDGMIRVSVGLEHREDILNQLIEAIELSTP